MFGDMTDEAQAEYNYLNEPVSDDDYYMSSDDNLDNTMEEIISYYNSEGEQVFVQHLGGLVSKLYNTGLKIYLYGNKLDGLTDDQKLYYPYYPPADNDYDRFMDDLFGVQYTREMIKDQLLYELTDFYHFMYVNGITDEDIMSMNPIKYKDNKEYYKEYIVNILKDKFDYVVSEEDLNNEYKLKKIIKKQIKEKL